MTSPNYKTFPELSAYIDRIGAEELNFRRFVVKEKVHGHYYMERCTIKIANDGTISTNSIEHAPTSDEVAAIKAELAKSYKEEPDRWPKARGAPNILKLKVTHDSNLFIFWDRPRKNIIMCQQRIDLDDGGKYYKPWTFFSDGIWRDMEPDGALPFWKPKTSHNKSKLMIHEGAKAAAFIDGLVNDIHRKKELKAHPWGEELAEYEHWGMIGGAQVPHRADYKELYAEQPLIEVIYVCDRDYDGESALQKVSKCYGRSMKGIQFSEEFKIKNKPGWDMADPMPSSLYKGKRWNGHSLEFYKCPATYATETATIEGKGRPPTVLKDVFAKEWIHSVRPDVYIHRDWPNKIYTSDEFDDIVRPFSGIRPTSELMMANNAIKSVEIKYVPSKPPGMFVGAGRYFNTHCPSEFKPEKGDPKPFIDFMEHLLPIEEDRLQTMRWIATLIARPEIKMQYGLLMISEAQGVGKGTLAERIMKPIIGDINTSTPSEDDVVNKEYTYWQSHKRLAIIHEIYAGHNSKAYNKLKSVITDQTISVKQKYLAPYDIDNWLHIIAMSNNFNALRLTGEDRRWLVPLITEKKKLPSYWLKMNQWLSEEGGLEIIVWWAHQFLEDNAIVGAGEPAPWTVAKANVIEESYSEGMSMVAEVLKAIQECDGKEWERCIILDTDLVGLIKDNVYEGRHTEYLEKPRTIRRAAKDLGWYPRNDKTTLRDGAHGKMICLDANDAQMPYAELYTEVHPTRIRKLGKRKLILEDGGALLNIRRVELEDEAVGKGIRLAVDNVEKTEK